MGGDEYKRTYLLLLILILPCFAVSATLDSKQDNSNGVAGIVPSQQSTRSHAESTVNKCSVVSPINPVDVQNDTPDIRLYSDAAGVVWQTWENGQCVHMGLIPMKDLILRFGSGENVSDAISCLPQYTSTTDTELSGASNIGCLSDLPVSTIGMWVLRENRSLGDLPTKVAEISSADGLRVAMTLKFVSETSVVLSLDGGTLVVVGTTKYPNSVDSEYNAIDGGASTIYYYYRYQYARLDYVWDGFVLAKAELWYTTGMDKRGGFQGMPRPINRYKAVSDDSLILQPHGPYTKAMSPDEFARNPCYLSEVAVTLNSHWDVFSGNVSISLLSTLCGYKGQNMYNFTTSQKIDSEWDIYFWAGNSQPGIGYVISFGPLKTGGGLNLRMSVLSWSEGQCVCSDSSKQGLRMAVQQCQRHTISAKYQKEHA